MRYDSVGDRVVLRRRALDPTILIARRRRALPVPGRGNFAAAPNTRLSGLGATSAASTIGTTASVAKAGYTAGAIYSSIGSATTAGATAGSFVPIIGTAIGAIVGLVLAGVFNHRQDPEVANLNAANAAWRANPNNLYEIANKFLVLAGFFDLSSGQLHGNFPLYRKYGRMGEGRFIQDMTAQIQQAANSGRITASDTPLTVYQKVVVPWMNSWGLGTLNDPINPGFLDALLTGLVAEYVAGLQSRWVGIAGQIPSIVPFRLPMSAQGVIAPPSAPAVIPPSLLTAPARASVIAPAAQLTPQQLVAQVPVIGTPVSYVPDMGMNGVPVAVPAGSTFLGRDVNNGSWIVQLPGASGQFVAYQGRLMTYVPQMFAGTTTGLLPATVAPAAITTSEGIGAGYNPAYGGANAVQAATATAQPVMAGTGGFLGLDPNTWLLIGSAVALSFALARPAGKGK